MNISEIDDKIIDRLWKGEAFSDKTLWEMFYTLTEDQARNYSKERWFKGRDVRGNHITRKLKKFWPAICSGVSEHRNKLLSDTSVQKLYKLYNSSLSLSILCYVAAGSAEDAERLAEILLPVSEGEAEKKRYVTLEGVYKQEELMMYLTSSNASIIVGMDGAIKELENARDAIVKRKNDEIRKIQSRLDAIKMLTAFSGTVEEDPPAEAETVAETEEVNT